MSKRAQPKQQNHSKIEKKSVVTTVNEAPSSGDIRSKEERCSRHLVTLQQQDKTENRNAVEASSMAAEFESNEGSFSFLSKEENSSDYKIDLDWGDINLSEILASRFNMISDFDDICTMDNVTEGTMIKNESEAKVAGEAFLVNEKMVEIGNDDSDCFEAKKESDFGSLGSFY